MKFTHILLFILTLSTSAILATDGTGIEGSITTTPHRPTFVIAEFPGEEIAPGVNVETGECQWFKIGGNPRYPLASRHATLDGVSTTADGIHIWFQTNTTAQGQWFITPEGHKIMSGFTIKQACTKKKAGRRLDRFISRISIIKNNNNQLTTYNKGQSLENGAPLGYYAQTIPCWCSSVIASSLASFKPDEILTIKKSDGETLLLEENPRFDTGCLMLNVFFSYFEHTPLLRSLLESLYWSYSPHSPLCCVRTAPSDAQLAWQSCIIRAQSLR